MSLCPLPIESESAEAFYASHVVEHLPNGAVSDFIKEAYRCLKSGGFLRLVTPDADLEYRAYRRGDFSFFHGQKKNGLKVYRYTESS